jgi:hypothetical protein
MQIVFGFCSAFIHLHASSMHSASASVPLAGQYMFIDVPALHPHSGWASHHTTLPMTIYPLNTVPKPSVLGFCAALLTRRCKLWTRLDTERNDAFVPLRFPCCIDWPRD